MANIPDHDRFMKLALTQAQIAFDEGEIPVGAILVHENQIISRGYNQVQKLNDPTAHAEMLAITAGCHQLGAKYLVNCSLYVTLEPCVMCAGAIKWAQISKIIYGASDMKAGFTNSGIKKMFSDKAEIISGVMERECRQILSVFFQTLR